MYILTNLMKLSPLEWEVIMFTWKRQETNVITFSKSEGFSPLVGEWPSMCSFDTQSHHCLWWLGSLVSKISLIICSRVSLCFLISATPHSSISFLNRNMKRYTFNCMMLQFYTMHESSIKWQTFSNAFPWMKILFVFLLKFVPCEPVDS